MLHLYILFIYLFIQKVFVERQSRLWMLSYPQFIEIIDDILKYVLVFYKIESWDDNV